MKGDADVAYHMKAKCAFQFVIVEPTSCHSDIRHLKEVGEDDALGRWELKRWKRKHPDY